MKSALWLSMVLASTFGVLGYLRAEQEGVTRETIRERFSTTEIHLVCPWHGWEYDVETGECVALRRYRLRRYEAVQRGDEVYVVA